MEIKKGSRCGVVLYHPHKKAAKAHPDKGGDKEDFQELALAYDILSDPKKRRKYDKDRKIPENDNLPNEASKVILKAFDKFALGSLDGDFIGQIKADVKRQMAAIPIKLKNVENFKELAEKTLKRIKFDETSPFPNVISISVRRAITDLDLQKETIERDHKILKLALEMLEYYSVPDAARPAGMIGNNTLVDILNGGRYA